MRDPHGRRLSPQEAQAIRGGIDLGRSPIGQHLSQVHHLVPDAADVDVFEFQATVTDAGAITQPAKQQRRPGYLYELYAIGGFMQAPATDPGTAALITFNIRDYGRSGNAPLFSSEISMASIVDVDSGRGFFPWHRGTHLFEASGGQIECKFDVASGYAAAANASKVWGVTLYFNLVAAKG